ncbi:MAG: ROK family protein [Phycisphaerales bacterium]|jgi:predicted NBD/HSP70 family sugar kinase|nr:ROK family protein [Phycisphaerales bacterium]
MQLVPRQRNLLRAIWRAGQLSRRDLHEATGVRPNTVGSDVAVLLAQHILRECRSTISGRGRPQVPLEIDPNHRHVVGLAIRPGYIETGQLNLLGQLSSQNRLKTPAEPAEMINTLRESLRKSVSDLTLAIGVSSPGFVDSNRGALLSGSAVAGSGPLNLQAAYKAAGTVPILLENDMHALAARWLLAHQAEPHEDVLLVYFEDGQLGSALLINGRPNRGCVVGANELGHNRFPIETDICFCGHMGCLERICSTPFLLRSSRALGSLAERAARFNGTDTAMKRMLDLLAMGFANAVNFTRVNRLVLVSEFNRHAQFVQYLTTAIRAHVLGEIKERVRLDFWDQPAARSAETAGWLALASFYYEGWNDPAATEPPQ